MLKFHVGFEVRRPQERLAAHDAIVLFQLTVPELLIVLKPLMALVQCSVYQLLTADLAGDPIDGVTLDMRASMTWSLEALRAERARVRSVLVVHILVDLKVTERLASLPAELAAVSAEAELVQDMRAQLMLGQETFV